MKRAPIGLAVVFLVGGLLAYPYDRGHPGQAHPAIKTAEEVIWKTAPHATARMGDGTSAKDLKRRLGKPLAPTDLTLKPFKSGPDPEDLYRTISTGLNGTPMPSYANVLTPEERWSIVSYILSIATRERPRGMMGLVGEEVQGMRIDMRAAMAGMIGGRE